MLGLLAGSLLVATMTGAAGSAGAAPVDPGDRKAEVDNQIRSQHTELDETSQELTAAYDTLKLTQGDVAQARAQLAAADGVLGTAEDENRETARQLEVAQANEAKANAELAKIAADTKQTQGNMGDIARHSYQSGGLGTWSMTLEALVGGQDPTDGVAMANTVMRYQKGVLRKLSTVRAEGTAQQDNLVAVRREVAHLKAKAEAGLLAAQDARGQAAAAKGKLDALEAKQSANAAAVETRKKAETADLKSMQAESDKLEKVLVARARAARARAAKAEAARVAREAKAAQEAKTRAAQVEAARVAREAKAAQEARAAREARAGRETRAAQAPHPDAARQAATPSAVPAAPRRGSGALSYPVNAPLSSPFGYRMHPILHREILHAGQDLAVACGTPVHAAADGDIVTSGWAGPSGQRVVIDHGLVRGVGLATDYFHLSQIIVRSGHVKRGQVIGLSGTTGRSTGCHLHFETLEDGVPVNPMKWL